MLRNYMAVIAFFAILAVSFASELEGPLGGPVTEPTETPTTGYFAPSNQPVDIPDFSWRTFPTGSSAMEHRPWVQPKVPTGPIVLPNSASVGPQYVGVMLPQPILPFANEYISYPQMPEGGSNLTPYQDFTGRLAPPIFLETDVEITAETEAELEQEADADAEADESLEESTEES